MFEVKVEALAADQPTSRATRVVGGSHPLQSSDRQTNRTVRYLRLMARQRCVFNRWAMSLVFAIVYHGKTMESGRSNGGTGFRIGAR